MCVCVCVCVCVLCVSDVALWGAWAPWIESAGRMSDVAEAFVYVALDTQALCAKGFQACSP